MTEYSSSPGAIREYDSARQRTSAWVRSHVPYEDFSSPFLPPSPHEDIESLQHATAESDAESSRSLPPRMVLRYPDGRDIRISHDHYESQSSRSHNPIPTHRIRSHHSIPQAQLRPSPASGSGASRSRSSSGPVIPQHISKPPSHLRASGGHISRSGTQTGLIPSSLPLATHQQSHRAGPSFVAPPNNLLAPSRMSSHPPNSQMSTFIRPQEDIRVLPTKKTSNSQASRNEQSNVLQSSLSRAQSSHNPDPSAIASSAARRAFTPSHQVLLAAPPIALSQSQPSAPVRSSSTTPAPIAYSQSHPPAINAGNMTRRSAAAGSAFHYNPPPIVYAPSKRSNNTYAPPAIVYSPSSSNSFSSRHTASIDQHPRNARPRPSSAVLLSPDPVTGSPDSWYIVNEKDAWVNRRREPISHHRSHQTDDLASVSSASPTLDNSSSRTPSSSTGSSQSTYYVIASPGQKVQLIVPEQSIVYAAGPKIRSPTSSQSSGAGSNFVLKRPFLSRLFRRDSDKASVVPNQGVGRRRSRRDPTNGSVRS